ncbi:hypothetical protein [Desulfonema ishimotonii]|nr:hypothetical protein [Desulfonema ishimotonii]
MIRISVFILIFISTALTFSHAARGDDANRPIPFPPDSVWFYNRDMKKVTPRISPEWVAVAFSVPSGGEAALSEAARRILRQDADLTDFFCDADLRPDACFFRLRRGMTEKARQHLMVRLGETESVRYVHPTLRLREKTVAFFDTIGLTWKAGVDSAAKERLAAQAGITPLNGDLWRVGLFRTAYFTALNLLAQDIRVAEVWPVWVTVTPSVRAELRLAVNGGNIGDRIPFTLRIVFSDIIRIDPAALTHIDLRPQGIQKELCDIEFAPFDYVRITEKSPVEIQGRIALWAPGEFSVPPVTIPYTCRTCPDTRVRSVRTAPRPLKIASFLPSHDAKKDLIVPEENLSPDFRIHVYHQAAGRHLALAWLGFLMAAGAVLWRCIQTYRTEQRKAATQAISGTDLALEALQAFLSREVSGPHWVYMAEAGKLFRVFLTEKYHMDRLPEGGTGALFFNAARAFLPPELRAGVGELLRNIDDAAALETGFSDEIADFRNRMNALAMAIHIGSDGDGAYGA